MSLKRPKVEAGLEPEKKRTKMQSFAKNRVEQFKQKRLCEAMDVIIAVFYKYRGHQLTQEKFRERLLGYDDLRFKPRTFEEMCHNGKYIGDLQREQRLSNNPNNKWEALNPSDIEQKIAFQQLTDCGFLIKTANNEIVSVYGQKQKWKWVHLEEDYTAIRNFEW